MDHKNILLVVDQLIKGHHFQCEWGIEWKEQQNYFELTFQFDLDNPNQLTFRDPYNNKISLSSIPFEMSVLFFNLDALNIEKTEYLVNIGVSQKRGIAYGELYAIIKYLKQLTSGVRVEWYEYLSQSEQLNEFKIKWDEQEFEQIRKGLIEANRYNPNPVFFPKKAVRGGIY